METKGTVKDSVKDSIENTIKKNNKGTAITYNTYINKRKRSIRFKAFILIIQYVKL